MGWLDYGASSRRDLAPAICGAVARPSPDERRGWYDPMIGKWNAVDPAAVSFANLSTYNYALNNPVGVIDPDGAYAIELTGEEAQEWVRQRQASMPSEENENPDPPGKGKKRPDTPLSYIAFSFGELLNGAKYAGSKAVELVFGSSEGKDGYHITSEQKVGPEPKLKKGSDYEIIDDPSSSMFLGVVANTIFGDGSMENAVGFLDPKTQNITFTYKDKTKEQRVSLTGDSMTVITNSTEGSDTSTHVYQRQTGLIYVYSHPLIFKSTKHVKQNENHKTLNRLKLRI